MYKVKSSKTPASRRTAVSSRSFIDLKPAATHPTAGPGADFQIDWTKADISMVHRVTDRSQERPLVEFAFDTYTKRITSSRVIRPCSGSEKEVA